VGAAERKDLRTPDETRTFEKGKVELVNIGGGVVGRLTLEPGWKWSRPPGAVGYRTGDTESDP